MEKSSFKLSRGHLILLTLIGPGFQFQPDDRRWRALLIEVETKDRTSQSAQTWSRELVGGRWREPEDKLQTILNLKASLVTGCLCTTLA